MLKVWLWKAVRRELNIDLLLFIMIVVIVNGRLLSCVAGSHGGGGWPQYLTCHTTSTAIVNVSYLHQLPAPHEATENFSLITAELNFELLLYSYSRSQT